MKRYQNQVVFFILIAVLITVAGSAERSIARKPPVIHRKMFTEKGHIGTFIITGDGRGRMYVRFSDNHYLSGGFIKEGDLFPLEGSLYEMGKIILVGQGDTEPDVFAKKVAKENWPQGITLQKNTFQLPITNETVSYGIQINNRTIKVKNLVFSAIPEKKPLSVTFVPFPTTRHEKIPPLDVNVGYKFQIDGRTYQLVNIVPSNAKTKIIGWVEFKLIFDKEKKAPANKRSDK